MIENKGLDDKIKKFGSNSKKKVINLKTKGLWEDISNKAIEVQLIKPNQMVADGLTKATKKTSILRLIHHYRFSIPGSTPTDPHARSSSPPSCPTLTCMKFWPRQKSSSSSFSTSYSLPFPIPHFSHSHLPSNSSTIQSSLEASQAIKDWFKVFWVIQGNTLIEPNPQILGCNSEDFKTTSFHLKRLMPKYDCFFCLISFFQCPLL